jgi:hypothetical protein
VYSLGIYKKEKTMVRNFLAAFCLLVVCAFAGAADELITLKDGTKYRGRIIIESPTRLVLKTARGKVTLEKALIKARKKALSVKDEFDSRANKIKDDNIEGWRQLARWSQSQGLKTKAVHCYEKVLAKSPTDEEAKKAIQEQSKAKAKAKLVEGAKNAEGNRGPQQIREKLEATQVHFDFGRAAITTIVTAISNAAGVQIKIDKAAMKDLKKRQVKLRYKSDSTAYRSVLDVTKHAKLDFLIDVDKVVIGTRSSINRLRKKLGIRKQKIHIITAAEARRILDSSKHTLRCSKKKFASVLAHLKKTTPVKYLYDGPKEYLENKVSFDCYQRSLRHLLERVLQPQGLDFMLQGNVVYIAPKTKIAQLRPKDSKQ